MFWQKPKGVANAPVFEKLGRKPPTGTPCPIIEQGGAICLPAVELQLWRREIQAYIAEVAGSAQAARCAVSLTPLGACDLDAALTRLRGTTFAQLLCSGQADIWQIPCTLATFWLPSSHHELIANACKYLLV